MTRRRRRHSAEFKVKAVLAVLKGDKTKAQLAGELEVHPMVLSESKQQCLASAHEVFDKGRRRSKNPEEEKTELFEEIGRLKVELEWLKKNQPHDLAKKRLLIERTSQKIPIVRVSRRLKRDHFSPNQLTLFTHVRLVFSA